MAPKFSVCIPIRNEASWLAGAIQSVLDQSFDDFELIIGDNASDDEIKDVIATFDDPRLVHHRFDELVLVNESWNRTIDLCRGEWVHPLSADDRMQPFCLERIAEQIDAFDDRGIVLVAGAVRRVNPQGEPDDIGMLDERQRRPLPKRVIAGGLHDASSWLVANAAPGIQPWMPGALAFRSSTIAGSGLFRPEMELSADFELVLRIAAYGPVVYIDEPLLDYTVRGNSATHRFVAEDLRRGDRTTMNERAWLAVLRIHEDRRKVSDEEKAVIRAAIARQLLQRAVWQRRVEAGRGRLAAIRDLWRAVRYCPRLLASPVRVIVAIGVVLAPDVVIDKATTIGHRHGIVVT